MIVYKVGRRTPDPRVFQSAIITPEEGGLTYTLGEQKVSKAAPMLVFETLDHARSFMGNQWDKYCIAECRTRWAKPCPEAARWTGLRPAVLPHFWRWLLSPKRRDNIYWHNRNLTPNDYIPMLYLSVVQTPDGTLMTRSLTPIRMVRPPDEGGTR